MTKRPPNILWISIEDTSPRFGCYGDTVARTPHLDRLAAQGRLYTRAYSTAAVCAPARAAIITGMYATTIGAHHMRTSSLKDAASGVPSYECVPPPFVRCFPEYLRAAGYFCTNNEKTDYQFAPPFTAWDIQGPEGHWRHRPDPRQPFFAVFNPMMTHESGMWPHKTPPPKTDPAALTLPPYLVDDAATRDTLARCYDRLAEADLRVGELLAQLEEDGLAEETVVMIWSDHGEGLPRSKRWPTETGLRVPLIVRWPGRIASGEVCGDLVSTLDLAPTVLELAGLPAPAHFQGQSFLSPNARPRTRPRKEVFSTRDRHDRFYDCVRSFRDERWRYRVNFRAGESGAYWNDYLSQHPALHSLWGGFRHGTLDAAQQGYFAPRPAEELYDVENDPYELHNLAEDPAHRPRLLAARERLRQWQRETGDLYDVPEYQMVHRFWPGLAQPATVAPLWIVYHDSVPHGLPCDPGTALELSGPVVLQLHANTEGSSIGYRLGPDQPWQLYRGAFPVGPGKYRLQARAIRIGFSESPDTELILSRLPD